MILRFRPCWSYPVGWSICWVYPVGWSIYGGLVEVERGQEGSIEPNEKLCHIEPCEKLCNRETIEMGARDDQLEMTE